MYQNDPLKVLTGKCRLSYEHLMAPHANNPGEEPRYSVTLLLPKSDLACKADIDQSVQAAVQLGITEKFGGVLPPNLRMPVLDGDGNTPSGAPFGEECKGHWVIRTSTKMKPEVVDINGQPIISATEVYSGMYARATIRFYPYNNNSKGITCTLGNVQKLADGEPITSRTDAATDFGAAPAPVMAPALPAPTAAVGYDPITGMPL